MEFGILGPLRVTNQGDEVDVGGPRRRSLLALLLVEANRAVPAEALAEQLWEGEPPTGAAGTLQSHVSHLRRSIGRDRIETHGPAYRLRLDAGELDAGRFEVDTDEGRRLLDSGDHDESAAVLARGLARWRGQALSDVGAASSILAEARRLEELRLVATESLLEAHLAAGRNPEVAAAARAAIAENPLRERLWAHLLVALSRDGRQAEALRAYQGLRKQLAEELGIDPSPELRALEGAILAQDAGLTPDTFVTAGPNSATSPTTLPSGVVTFLLTDVVGSTRLWESAPEAMARALARHDALLREAVESHDGTLLKARGEGDSTFSVFRRATDALGAAHRADLALAAEPWPEGAEIRVRAAIHSGEVQERDGDYYGRAVNRAARLRGMAEAGQVLLSRPTADLVIDHLPDECSLVELGTRQLRDLERSETVFLLVRSTEPPDPPDRMQAESVFPPRLASARAPKFVGRLQEMETIELRRTEALSGQPRLLLLGGEPGIGKTSLAAEGASRAHADGAMVLYGRCDPDLGIPYLPWVEAVEQLISQSPTNLFRGNDDRTLADLARLVPALDDRLPEVPTPPSDPDGDRYRLFGAVTSALATAAEACPLVLVLDDLHWADKPTLLMLRHVIGAASGQLLVIGTYRPSDLSADHPLTDLLAVLRREPRADRVAVGGLGDADAVSLVEALSGHRITGAELALVHAVQRETDGNPFFTVELLQHLAEAGVVVRHEDGRWSVVDDPAQVGLPESVREVIGRRVAHLGEHGHRVLDAAAVIGRSFQLDVLASAVDSCEDDVLIALEQAEAAALVTSIAPGEFIFTHALIGHALYEGLGATRRARLHRRVAEAIEQLEQAERRVNELARHWAAGARPTDLDKAIGYAATAGRDALAALAPDEAARWFGQAAAMAERLPETDERLRSELLLWLGRAQRQAAIPDYRETLLDAARAAEHLGDAGLLARAALANNRGLFSGAGVVDEERVAVLRSALDAVPSEDSAQRARLLATLAAELAFDADSSTRRRLTDHALAMARRLGDPTVLVNVLALRFSAIWTPDMLDERIANMAEAREAAAATGNATAAAWVETLAHLTEVEAGDMEAADRSLERIVHAAEHLGMPFLRSTAYMYRSSRALRVGDLAEAERLAHAARDIGLGLGRQEWGSVTGPIFEVYWYQGRLQEMSETLDLDDVELGEQSSRRAWISARSGDPTTARRLLDAAMHSGVADRPDQWMWLVSASIWAEVASHVRAVEHAEPLYAALRPFHDRVVANASNVFAVVAQPLGMLAELLGDAVAADEHFGEAITVAERVGSSFLVARVQAAWGTALVGRDPRHTARGEELLRTALDTATRVGWGGLAQEARDALEPLAPRS